MPIFVDIILATCYLSMKRGQSAGMKDRRERDMANWEGREDESTSVRKEVFSSKRPEKPVYALFGRNCDRIELIDVHFSRIA